MEPITIGLIIMQVISFLMHTYHFKNSKCRIGSATSCCEISTEIEENSSSNINSH